MREKLLLILVISFSFILSASQTWADETCECQNATCKPCETETGLTFYTEKCGPENARVKSCKRPTCVPVEDQKQCLADLNTGSEPLQKRKPAAQVSQPVEKASVTASTSPVAHIEALSGAARITHVNSLIEKARVNLRIFQGDKIETEDTAKVKIAFENGDSLIVNPKTSLVVTEIQYEKEKKVHKTLLDLKFGMIRSLVEKNKYDGKTNTYKVRTKAAVAGVRGTDFVTSFTPGEKEWVTEVHTFDGSVNFGGAQQEKQVDVSKGTYASFVVEGPPDDQVTDAELSKFLEKGYMSEVFKMTEDKAKALDIATNFEMPKAEDPDKADRKTAGESVCVKPAADYKQCSWTCENNPKGEKTCRTDLKGVHCVRHFCNANGNWTNTQRLPASQGDMCQSDKPVVRDCGEYW